MLSLLLAEFWCEDVPSNVNKMRLSPVLMAAFAAVATVGWSNSAKAQAPGGSQRSQADPTQVIGINSSAKSIQPQEKVSATKRSSQDVVVKTVKVSEVSVPDTIAPQPLLNPFRSKLAIAAAQIAQTQGGTLDEQQPTPIQLNPPSSTSPTLTLPVSPPPTPREAPTPDSPPATPAVPSTTPPEATEPEPRVLVGEVIVVGAEADLQAEVYRVIRTQPGRTTTRSQLQEDINAIFATGFFQNVKATPADTPLGVRVTFEVQPNSVLKSVQLEGARVVPAKVVSDIFTPQYGTTLNLRQLQTGIQALTKWYQDNGYVLAQVVDVPKVAADGSVTLEVAEGVVEGLQVRFVNKQGEEKDEKGNPIRGRTRDFIVTREFELKPGDVFNRTTAERDLQRAFGLGIFEDIKLALNPGQDPRKVIVVANVTEKNTGNIGVAGGFSSASGLFGSVSYQQQNVGGNNQKLNAEVQIGQRDQLFDLSFTDPWIGGDPFRTSYTVNLFRRRTISLVFDGGDPEIELLNGDRPRVLRTGGGISFNRPLERNPFKRAEWNASLGLQYQRVSIRDADGKLTPRDELGNLLSFDSSGKDDLITARLGFVRDRRNSFLTPTSGSVLSFSTEQSVPFGSGSILFNRLRANYSFYIPVRLTRLTPGCRDNKPLRIGEKPPTGGCPQAFAFNIQGGSVLGDLPPYEAFPLGGTNSVRGYDEGDVGSGRSYLQATAEYRFPVFSIISGALFVDAASDLGTGNNVPGDPAGARGKPGSGIGYGVGVRVQSPLGPIRIDFGINDQGGNNIRFGFGERF